jgi:hypothetical protein
MGFLEFALWLSGYLLLDSHSGSILNTQVMCSGPDTHECPAYDKLFQEMSRRLCNSNFQVRIPVGNSPRRLSMATCEVVPLSFSPLPPHPTVYLLSSHPTLIPLSFPTCLQLAI